MTASNWVTAAALLAGTVSFAFYCWATASLIVAKAAVNDATGQTGAVLNTEAKSVSVPDFTKLLEALGGLTTSLSKASPALTALIGAVLMFAIAAVASGAISGSPSPTPANPTPPAAKAPSASPSKPSS